MQDDQAGEQDVAVEDVGARWRGAGAVVGEMSVMRLSAKVKAPGTMRSASTKLAPRRVVGLMGRGMSGGNGRPASREGRAREAEAGGGWLPE